MKLFTTRKHIRPHHVKVHDSPDGADVDGAPALCPALPPFADRE